MGEHFALKNNQIFVLAEAAGGVYNSDQIRVLCEVADNESAFLKITEDQRIGFMIDPGKLPDVQAQVRKSGLLLRSYKAAGVPAPRACLGELCSFAHQPSLGDALELTTHLLKSFPSPKRYSTIGVNGCGRACLASSTEDIHVVAEETGYKISIGGKGSDIPQQAQLLVENVSRADLPLVIEKILAVFYQESQENDRIFDVIERIGLTPFINALPEHLVPHVSEAPADVSSEAVTANELSEGDSELIALPEVESGVAEGQTGLVVEDTTAELIDDLLDSTSAEFAVSEPLSAIPSPEASTEVTAELSDGLSELDEPVVDIANDVLTASAVESEVPVASSDNESELLEEAEFEDGTLEDVERVRDAIRTELSMSANSDAKESHQPSDLLDELDQENNDPLALGEDTNPGHVPFAETNETVLDDFPSDTELESAAVASLADDFDEAPHPPAHQDFESHTAASIEHQSPNRTGRRAQSKVSSAASARSEKRAPAPANTGVSGRLAIKFLGEQLAVELPSGMCFELPFDAVPEGSEFSMLLPDGELRLERDGAMLNVQLGLLNMRFPIPNANHRNVA